MSEVVKKATRQSYGESLAELAKNPKVLVFDADLSHATMTCEFQKVCPERFINCGIAEQNMVGVAAGAATCGYIPFVSTFAMFVAGRAFDSVRNMLGYTHMNVKIGATHAGISVGEDGATHQCLEDIGLMRTIPGMTILNPADDVEAKAAIAAAVELDGPVYLRFGRLPIAVFNTNADYKFEIGKAIQLADGKDVTIIATGILVGEAIEAAKQLAAQGISARVLNMHTIKPIDKDAIIKAAKETGAIVTAEEHNIIGGLGSAVAEVLCEGAPAPLVRIGIQDEFGKSGKGAELLKIYGLSAENIVEKAKQAVSMKK